MPKLNPCFKRQPDISMRFKLNQYNRNVTKEELLTDLVKVAQKLNLKTLTQIQYNEFGKYSSALIKKRFGWNKALELSGLNSSRRQNILNDELILDLKRVAKEISPEKLTIEKYNRLGKFSAGLIGKRLGWNEALLKAGLEISNFQTISERTLFDNLELVWTTLGRQPKIQEMIKPLSKFSGDTYRRKFGTWRKSLENFVNYINSDEETKTPLKIAEKMNYVPSEIIKHKTKRFPSAKLKVQVLMRDGNRCKLCGITVIGSNIHFDHIIPWAKGGETTLENLQILCSEHNLAKGTLEYPERDKFI
jgi:hypothetical protein